MSNLDKFIPFDNNNQSCSVGDMTIENGTDSISIYGNIKIDKSKNSLKDIEKLIDIFNKIQLKLNEISELPKEIQKNEKNVDLIRNPFN